MTQFKTALLFPLIALMLASWCSAAEPVPTAAEAHQFFNDGKYKESIRAIAKIMASKVWSAKEVDRYDLLTLKGEAHLRLKESTLAGFAFDAAAKETGDKTAAVVARITAHLIKHSSGIHYTPKVTADKRIPGKPIDERPTIDIIDPESRKTALTALWQDERNAAEPKIKLASEGDSIQAVLDAAPIIAHLTDFDIVAHGSDNDTRAAAGQVLAHGKDLLAAMVEKMGVRTDVINGKAMKVEQFKMQIPSGRGNNSQDIWRRHGMEKNEPAEIKDIVSTTEKIPLAVQILIDDLVPDKDFFKQILADNLRIHDKAKATLDENYGETYYKRPAN